MTRLRRYATAACDSAESTASRVVICKHTEVVHFQIQTKIKKLGVYLIVPLL